MYNSSNLNHFLSNGHKIQSFLKGFNNEDRITVIHVINPKDPKDQANTNSSVSKVSKGLSCEHYEMLHNYGFT